MRECTLLGFWPQSTNREKGMTSPRTGVRWTVADGDNHVGFVWGRSSDAKLNYDRYYYCIVITVDSSPCSEWLASVAK
jgi:hypothetical protein